MGGCLNIEIHQNLNSNDQFISSLKNILKPALNQEQLMKFINSVKLHNEEDHYWYEYEKIKVKFHQNVLKTSPFYYRVKIKLFHLDIHVAVAH
jgi:hypothetical protein